jgi:hypothetical protein
VNVFMRIKFIVSLIVCLPLMLKGQAAEKIISIPEWTIADNQLGQDETPAIPATLNLIPVSPDGPTGQVWVRYDGRGIVIWGKASTAKTNVDHAVLQKRDVQGSEHVEIWLASEDEVQMPPIGWNALEDPGPVALTKADECAEKAPEMPDCATWYRQQVEYRAQFKRLFVRQWLAAPGENGPAEFFEDYATAAYATLQSSLFKRFLPEILEPKGTEKTNNYAPSQVEIDMGWDRDGQLRFHAIIPYAAFPPARQLELRDLRLMVDVFNAAPEGKKTGGFSTTSPIRKWGAPTTFNRIRLASSARYVLSPCGYPLETAPEQNNIIGWYQPVARSLQFAKPVPLSSSLSLENPGGDWLSGGPDGNIVPHWVSPEVKLKKYFWKQTEDGTFVCGPTLSWWKNERTKRSNAGLQTGLPAAPDGNSYQVDSEHFAVKSLPDHWNLVLSGPTTSDGGGRGTCGGAPFAVLSIYALNPSGEFSRAGNIEDEYIGCGADSPDDVDFKISSDWKRITHYQAYSENHLGKSVIWNATDYCLEGHEYKQCSEEKNVKPPMPRNFGVAE